MEENVIVYEYHEGYNSTKNTKEDNKYLVNDNSFKKNNKNTIIFILKSTIIGAIIGAILALITIMGKTIYENRKIIETANFIRQNYYNADTNNEDLNDIMVEGIINNLPDKYSIYLNDELSKKSGDEYEGINSDIGFVINNNYVIKNITSNSPADKAGLKIDDKIIKIDNIDTVDNNGKEIGENLDKINDSLSDNDVSTFIVLRNNEELTLSVKKASYKTEILEYKMIDDIGFIKLTTFSDAAHEKFDSAIKLFKEKKAKGIILDLRYNLGGKMVSLKYIADALMKDVTVGTVVYNDNYNTEVIKTDSDALDLPIVVLTNELSASCSEVLAGTIVANNKGITIGTNTYGKGTVLVTMTYNDGSTATISTGELTLSNGDKIEGVGIKPTIEEVDESKHIDLAIDYLNKNN